MPAANLLPPSKQRLVVASHDGAVSLCRGEDGTFIVLIIRFDLPLWPSAMRRLCLGQATPSRGPGACVFRSDIEQRPSSSRKPCCRASAARKSSRRYCARPLGCVAYNSLALRGFAH